MLALPHTSDWAVAIGDFAPSVNAADDDDDGVFEASTPAPGLTIAANTLPLSIGAQDDGARPFEGTLDEVWIWGRALSPEEVADLAL